MKVKRSIYFAIEAAILQGYVIFETELYMMGKHLYIMVDLHYMLTQPHYMM